MGEKKSTKFPPDEWFEVNNPSQALHALVRAASALEKGDAPDPPAAKLAANIIKRHLIIERNRLTANPRLQNHPATILLRNMQFDFEEDKGGRGRLFDYLNKVWVVGAVWGARQCGVTGDAAFECAIEYLKDIIGFEYTLSSIKKTFYDNRKHYDFDANHISANIWIGDMYEPAQKYIRRKPS